MGSASQPMLVVKANRALLRKRRSYSDIREVYDGYTSETNFILRNLTHLSKRKFVTKIIAQAKRIA